jgi:hypothetical protein
MLKHFLFIFIFILGCSGERTNRVEVTGKVGPRGEAGPAGPRGEMGDSGSSVVCDFLETEDGVILRCGEKSVLIRNGKDGDSIEGPRGEPGHDGIDGIDGESCQVTKNQDGSITIKCKDTEGTIPGERKITICIYSNGRYVTKRYPVSQFIAEVYGRFDYYVGACGGECK